MQTHILGYPRIGSQRELKKASEQYWAGKLPADQLMSVGKSIRLHNWTLQKNAGIDLIPTGDFSFYDQVLDTSLMVGAIPERYHDLQEKKQLPDIDLLFAMARGYQKDGYDVTAMEMTKWFAWNMPFHAEHHAYPSVPFHALPKLNAIIADRIAYRGDGYRKVTRQTWAWFRRARATGARTEPLARATSSPAPH